MSTSRSALELLREEPELVGAVLHLVAANGLRVENACNGVSLRLFALFVGVPESEILDDPGPWPSMRHVKGRRVIPQHALASWLRSISSDRSDFAPAVPRALPGGRA